MDEHDDTAGPASEVLHTEPVPGILPIRGGMPVLIGANVCGVSDPTGRSKVLPAIYTFGLDEHADRTALAMLFASTAGARAFAAALVAAADEADRRAVTG